MKNLVDEIEKVSAETGSVALWWLGQAGFAFKTSAGEVVYLDPYLSDMVESVAGFKRLSLSPVDFNDVAANWVICSHEHPDHLDSDALSAIAANNPKCRFAGSVDCGPEFDRCAISKDRQLIMEPGCSYNIAGITVHAARADHGELSPSALSLLFDFRGVKVMFSGDTSFNPEYLRPLLEMEPDLLLPCINGSFGNMNGLDAARLTAIARPKFVIPCHFWMFKEHHVEPGGDPYAFCEACEKLCPDVQIRLLTPGEGIVVSPNFIRPI